MCGIVIIWGSGIRHNPRLITNALRALEPRGPDNQTYEVYRTSETYDIAVGFTRLHIQGARGGVEQPFVLTDNRMVLCNGEVFNAEALIKENGLDVPAGGSDCAVIPALLAPRPGHPKGLALSEVCRQLDGDFAIAVVDIADNSVSVARDPYGVRPLYYAVGAHWEAVVSELKALPPNAEYVREIAPGTTQVLALDPISYSPPTTWHEVPWLKNPYLRVNADVATLVLRHSLEEAVIKRLTTVRDIGACLSGGLDSSLVAAIAARYLREKGQQLHTYSVGMSGSADLAHARLVAEHIGSIHHEWVLTPKEFIERIPDVVRAIETFDITTVRASVGNYLVGELVASSTPTVKVVLNGDGADELLGGYLYMRAAPDNVAFETETDRLMREIHRYDVARSERSMAAHGLESRSPFLDRQFVAVARSLPTDLLRPTAERIEKNILRAAFADTGLLPNEVLWRRKEAFSDGVSAGEGPSWFEIVREEGRHRVRDHHRVYDINPPPTDEARWYREIWGEHFPDSAAAVVAPAMWMPRWMGRATDPSARTLSLYAQSQNKQRK